MERINKLLRKYGNSNAIKVFVVDDYVFTEDKLIIGKVHS
jgi:hypothetical protein